MFNRKIETVGTVSEFLNGEYKVQRTVKKVNKRLVKLGAKVAVTVVAGSLFLDITTPMAFAQTTQEAIAANAVGDAFGSAVNKALQPLIDVLKELAKPIAGIMVTWGCLRFMIGQKEPGINNIQQAALGYILVQLSPLILNLITGVGNSIA